VDRRFGSVEALVSQMCHSSSKVLKSVTVLESNKTRHRSWLFH
jgi:hypothetical protein